MREPNNVYCVTKQPSNCTKKTNIAIRMYPLVHPRHKELQYSLLSTVSHRQIVQEWLSNWTSTMGNSERYYHQVCLGFARGVVDGGLNGLNPMTLDQKCSIAVVDTRFFVFVFFNLSQTLTLNLLNLTFGETEQYWSGGVNPGCQ